MNLIEARERETKLFAELQTVLDGAEGRQLTPEECEKVEKMNREADEVQARIRSAQVIESAEMRLGSARGGWEIQGGAVSKNAATDFRGFARGAYGQEFRALPITSGASPEAGDTLGLGLFGQFIEIMNRLSPMRQVCAVDSFSTSDIRYPIQSSQVTVDDDTSEGGVYDNFEPTFGAKTPTPRKYAVKTSVSNEAIEDSAFDLESIIFRQQGEALAYAQDQQFLMGEGVAANDDTLFESWASDGGILKVADSATTLTIQEMVQGLCSLAPTGYFGRPGAFVVAAGLIDDLLTQGDSVSRPLLQAQAASSFSIESPFQIFGRPVYVTSGGPAMTAGNFCAAYVAQGAARIADVGGLTFLRDPYTSASNGLVNMVASMRSAFAITEPKGIVSYQLGA